MVFRVGDVLVDGLLAKVRAQKDKYFEAKIDKQVPIDFCERKIAECIQEEETLEAALAKTSDKHDDYQKLGIAIHELAYKAKEIYEKATTDERRLLLSQLFTNLAQDGLKIKPEFTLAAEYLSSWVPLNEDYELQKTLTTQGKTGTFVPASPAWLRG